MTDVSAQVLCTAAMRKLRILDPSETPNSTELDNFFTEMLRMLKTWAAKGVLVPYGSEDVHTLTAGTASYTIGSGGTINTTRPVSIMGSTFIRANGRDTRLRIIGESRWGALTDKTTGADEPSLISYRTTYPLGTILLWPPGGGDLHLWSKKHFTEPAAVGNDVVFEEEFQDAIVWNLTCRMSPEFIGDPTPYQMAMAEKTLDEIMSLNEANDPEESDCDIRMLNNGITSYDIDGG